SPCTTKEEIPDVVEGYRYTTILLPEELTSYCHTPRIESGGLRTVNENIPYFSVPKHDDGEIYLGHVISPENGEPTNLKYTLKSNELMHGLIAGASGAGKTQTALRFINGIVNEMKLPALILDWKSDWRVLKYLVEPERFEYFGLDNFSAVPIKMNLFLPPKNVPPTTWKEKILESLSVSFGLGPKQYGILFEATQRIFWAKDVIIYQDRNENILPKKYDDDGILDLPSQGVPELHPEWEENIYNVSLTDLYFQLKAEKEYINSFGMQDTYESILTRLGYYASGELKKLYASKDRDAYRISDLMESGIDENKVMVLEGGNLDPLNKKFVIHLFAQGIFLYAKALYGKTRKANKMLVVFEEAHQVIPNKNKGGNQAIDFGEDVFEALCNESRGYGLYNLIMVQSPSELPKNVVANCSIVIGHRVNDEEDAVLLTKTFNRDERFDSRDVVRWLYREPIGQAVVISKAQFDHIDAEPALVAIDHIPIEAPTDEELLDHYEEYYK
ncbi:MAG: helicase HerA domain-containing protein, partial [Candidatus Woesearchaeota archaeon]